MKQRLEKEAVVIHANICKASKLQQGTCLALWSLKCMVMTYD